jgi:hypothetical protein
VTQLLDPRGSQGLEVEPLWPYLLVLALLLNLFEVAWRKGHFEKALAWMRRRGPRVSAQPTYGEHMPARSQ